MFVMFIQLGEEKKSKEALSYLNKAQKMAQQSKLVLIIYIFSY